MTPSTGRLLTGAALLLFSALAAFLLRDGLGADRVLVDGSNLGDNPPWAAALQEMGLDASAPHNRSVVDQSRIYYPYLAHAARVYQGEADPLWTSRAGGGQPFLGNITSSLFHPLTLLAAFVPLEQVPLLQGLATLILSALFTWLFLRRLGLSVPASLFGAVAFGFGGHQVLWLQYALAHTLVALPACFWAVELVVNDRSRRRLALLALAFSMLVFGGHPETGLIAAMVAGLWALWRLWDSHGRWLCMGVAVLAVLLSAIQWLPFLDYAFESHGLVLRDLKAAADSSGMSWAAAGIFTAFFLFAALVLRASSDGSLTKMLLAVVGIFVVAVMARRMGMALAASSVVLPNLYGSPVDGGAFTAAQDYPGLNAGYAGVLPLILLSLGAVVGLGGGFVRFFAWIALLLWGAAFHMPGAESLVRALPGLGEVGSTRLLGPVGFVVACGGAKVLDVLTGPGAKPGHALGMLRVGSVVAVALAASGWVLSLPVEPMGGSTVVAELTSPAAYAVHLGDKPIPIEVPLSAPVRDLRISIDGKLLRSGPAAPGPNGEPHVSRFVAQRAQEGNHRLRAELWSPGQVPQLLADQPLIIKRKHQLTSRDLLAAALALLALAVLCLRRDALAAGLCVAVVVVDMAGFGERWNLGSPADQLYPPTRTVDFLQAQPGPFRIFTEGTILPPETQFMAGVDHLLSYDNIGYQRTYQWLITVMDMDHFGSFSFDRSVVDYGNPRFDALDVRYVLTANDTDLSDIPGFERVHSSEVTVWENTENLGRAFVVGRWALLDPARAGELERMDPAEFAFLEEMPSEPLGGRGVARVVEHAGSRIRVEVEASGPALLVLAENWNEDWTASIDGGEATPTQPCDVAWQAVRVPAGRHEVQFVYSPGSVDKGLMLSLAAVVVLLAMLVLPRQLS